MQIFVKLPDGKTITLNVNPTESVASVKTLIKNKEGIPRQQQRLIFKGEQLEDGHTIDDYYIDEGSEIQLVQRLTGGGKRAIRGEMTTPQPGRTMDGT